MPASHNDDVRKGVFRGEIGTSNYLNPDNHPYLPLVELPSHLNPYDADGVHIYVKLMTALPLGNVKSLPAYHMLATLARDGALAGKDTIIESSSGNTVASLAVLGKQYGLTTTRAMVSSEVSEGKLQLLRLMGVEVEVNDEPICPDPSDPESGIYRARTLARDNTTWVNPGQYENEANPNAHVLWTAPQLWDQTDGTIRIFCAGLGTTGTLMGVGTYLKERNPDIHIVGVARKPNNPVPGVRTAGLLREVAFDWRSRTDRLMEVDTIASFRASLQLCREGILVGPSAGFAYAGLLDYLSELKADGTLARMTIDGELTTVFLAPDGPLPYLADYFEYLDESEFPPIHNIELLTQAAAPAKIGPTATVPTVAVDDAYPTVYATPLDELIVDGTGDQLQPDVRLIDVRRDDEFEDHHLPGAKHIELDSILVDPDRFVAANAGKRIIFVCAHGNRSTVATQIAREHGLDASSLAGGTAAWSSLGLGRVTPASCKV